MMKNFFVAVVAVFVSVTALAKNQVITDPKIDYTPNWLEVQKVEMGKDAIAVHCNLNPAPNWWVKVSDSTVLRDRKTGHDYRFLRVEGIEANEKTFRPASGELMCTIYFEPVGHEVTEVNMIDTDPDAMPHKNLYGLHLTKPKKEPQQSIYDPRKMTADYYMSQPYTPDTAWRFSNEPYRDMKFYRSGKARVELHVDNRVPELADLFGNVNLIVYDLFTNKGINYNLEYDDEGNAEIEINLPGPQFVNLVGLGGVFVQPNDTIEIFTTEERDNIGRPRYMTFRGNSESAQISTLVREMRNRIDAIMFERGTNAVAKGRDGVTEAMIELGEKAEEIMTGEETRKMLVASPLSRFGKDITVMSAIGDLITNIEEVRQDYDDTRFIKEPMENGIMISRVDTTWVPLDYDTAYAPLIRNKALIYDNPLGLCTNSQWVFINRAVQSPIVDFTELEYDDKGRIIGTKNFDKFGVEGMFLCDISKANGICAKLNFYQSGGLLDNNRIRNLSTEMAEILSKMNYPKVIKSALDEYTFMVSKLTSTGGEDFSQNWNAAQKALWHKIVEPYLGNIMYVDFWSMGCGPCRSGMISMKATVEAMKDEPFRVLYICDENGSREAEAWMAQENIKGEHIYVTKKEWGMLEEMFNITGIPRSALVGKEGEILQDNFNIHMSSCDALRDRIRKAMQ